MARQSNDFVDTIINNLRVKERFNVISFQRDGKISFRNIVKALRKKQVLAILENRNADE